MNEKELIEKRNEIQDKMEKILNKAKEEKRAMTEDEIKNFDLEVFLAFQRVVHASQAGK